MLNIRATNVFTIVTRVHNPQHCRLHCMTILHVMVFCDVPFESGGAETYGSHGDAALRGQSGRLRRWRIVAFVEKVALSMCDIAWKRNYH